MADSSATGRTCAREDTAVTDTDGDGEHCSAKTACSSTSCPDLTMSTAIETWTKTRGACCP